MVYSQNIFLEIDKENSLILDSQSKILNWLYNHLLDECQKNYQNFKDGLITEDELIIKGRYGLRDYMVNEIKPKHSFLSVVYSKPLKEVSTRLNQAFKMFMKKQGGYPNFRAWKKNWFSLYYDEPFVGYSIEDDVLIVNCGKDINNKKIIVKAKLTEKLRNGKLKTLRICKKLNRFYVNLIFEKPEKVKCEIKSWVSIDQNHKNFFCAVDSNSQTMIFEKNNFIKYTEKQIDEIKGKRDVKKRLMTKENKNYTDKYKQYTKQYQKLTNRVSGLWLKLREQKKTFCYTIANNLFDRYDLVIIGDYTPDLNTAVFDTMHRSMLNQEMIGMFRRILQQVADKRGKHLIVKSEMNTTKTCCFCGDMKTKIPDIREFVCTECGKKFLRDLNSAYNIGEKEIKMLSGTDFLKTLDLSVFNYSLTYSFAGISKHELNN